MISLEKLATAAFVGKILVDLEYEAQDGYRREHFGKKIKSITVAMNECREDAGIYLDFEGGDDVFVYSNEGVEVKDEMEV